MSRKLDVFGEIVGATLGICWIGWFFGVQWMGWVVEGIVAAGAVTLAGGILWLTLRSIYRVFIGKWP